MMLNSRYNAIHSKIKEANMKKRLLSLMMALLLVLTLVPAAAFAGKSETDVEYTVIGGSIWFDKSTAR